MELSDALQNFTDRRLQYYYKLGRFSFKAIDGTVLIDSSSASNLLLANKCREEFWKKADPCSQKIMTATKLKTKHTQKTDYDNSNNNRDLDKDEIYYSCTCIRHHFGL